MSTSNNKFNPDTYAASFTNRTDFVQEMLAKLDDTQWIEVNLNELQFFANPASENHMPLMLQSPELGESQKAIGETAWKTILERARVNGFGFTRLLESNTLAPVLNILYPLISREKGLLCICGDTIRAIHSANEYKIFDASDLFEAVEHKLTEQFPNTKFDEGYIDHRYYRSSFRLQSGSLDDLYAAIAIDHGIDVVDAHANILWQSSDTGCSCTYVSSYLQNDMGVRLPIGTPLKVEHKGSGSIEKFTNKLDNLFALYQRQIEDIAELSKCYIKYPLNCFRGVVKSIGLPVKYAVRRLANFSHKYENATDVSALQLYWELAEILTDMERGNESATTIYRYEDVVARASKPGDWIKCDLSEAVHFFKLGR